MGETVPIQVVSGATTLCSFGVAPGTLTVLPVARSMAGGPPAASIMDNVPFLNIAPFGMCTSMANPSVASATAAALGVLTPMPCTPVTAAPWAPGASKTLIGGKPALDNSCKLNCSFGGVIQIVQPGQFTVMVS